MASYLMEQGQVVDNMLYFAPDEAEEFSSPLGTFSIQAHFASDGVSEAIRLRGVNVFVELNYLSGDKVQNNGHVRVLRPKILDKLTDVLGNIASMTGQSVFSSLFSVSGQWSVTETATVYTFSRNDTVNQQTEERKKKVKNENN